jgi:hypothetical protein
MVLCEVNTKRSRKLDVPIYQVLEIELLRLFHNFLFHTNSGITEQKLKAVLKIRRFMSNPIINCMRIQEGEDVKFNGSSGCFPQASA